MIHAINDAVWPEDDFADVRHVILGNHETALGLFQQHVRVCDEPKRKGLGALRTVAGNESDYVAQVIAGERRPSQFVSHEAICRFISSWGMPSPRSS